SNSDSLIYTPVAHIADGETRYYYAQIRQADGNMIWTSPIWFTRNDDLTKALPVPTFEATSSTTICQGGSVSFLDLSSNAPDSILWKFPGGNPSFSGLENPVVRYDSVGVYPVELVAYNSNGADSVLK